MIQRTEATDAASDSLVQEQQFNPLFEVFGPSVDQRGMPLEGARVGYAAIKDTQKINAYLRMPQVAPCYHQHALCKVLVDQQA
jgi:hypothetical protein